MSLASNISDAFVRVATECKTLRTLINGNATDLTALGTTTKTNLVAAINELNTAIKNATNIDDTKPAATTTTYSASKINAAIAALINDSASGTTNTWSASYIASTIAGLINDAALSTDLTHTFSAKHILELLTALINDSNTTSTSVAWSSTKTKAQIAALIADGTTGSVTTWSSTKITGYVTAALGSYTQINDAATNTSSTWSSQKVSDSITAAINNLVAGAPAALDTLKEIADKLAADDTALGSILTSLDNRVRVDAAQTFTSAQKIQARANIDVPSVADDAAKVSYTTSQSLTTAQKTIAQGNINAADATAVGDTTTNLVTVFTNALA